MYYPVSTSYACARHAQISSKVIDDYLVYHNLVNPEAPKKNRWRKLGYRNDPHVLRSTLMTVSCYDDWTTDKKVAALLKSHEAREDSIYHDGTYPLS